MFDIWKPVVGWENSYYVSNQGKIFSVFRHRILKDRIDKKGYNNVCFSKNGEQHFFKVSHIVARAFPEICGVWFEGCEIDHLNGNRADNRPENLKVCTHKENINNPVTKKRYKGRKLPQLKKQAEKCKKGVLVGEFIFTSQREASSFLGISEVQLCAIKHKRQSNTTGQNITFLS